MIRHQVEVSPGKVVTSVGDIKSGQWPGFELSMNRVVVCDIGKGVLCPGGDGGTVDKQLIDHVQGGWADGKGDRFAVLDRRCARYNRAVGTICDLDGVITPFEGQVTGVVFTDVGNLKGGDNPP